MFFSLSNKKQFTHSSLIVLKNFYHKLYNQQEHKKHLEKLIHDLENDNEEDNENDDFFHKSKLEYIVDPLYDSVLQRNYFTKFRLSNVEKIKILSERNKKIKNLESEKKKVNQLNQVAFKEELIDLKNECNNDNNSEFDDLLSEESELEKHDISNKEMMLLQEKRRLSINSNHSNLSKQSNKSLSSEKGSCVLISPKNKTDQKEKHVDPIIEIKNNKTKTDNSLDLKEQLKEKEKHSPIKVNEPIINKTSTKQDEEQLSELDDDFSEDTVEYEDEYYDDDYNEGEEAEDDDFEELTDDMLLNDVDISKLSPKQQQLLSQLFELPYDFKKDLFKKEKNEKDVDYKSLELAIDNATQNMKNLKALKKEYLKQKKTPKGLLGSGTLPLKPNKSIKKVKFEIYSNKVKSFDKKKIVILDSTKGKEFNILPNPSKGCLKKK